jgi:DNA-binding CsgD family transcriptional regulator
MATNKAKKSPSAAKNNAIGVNEIILAHPVFNLMQWLANSPSGDEVARELVMNYFQNFGATMARLVVTDAEGTLYFIGSFGFENHLTGTSQTFEHWQSRTDEIVKIDIGTNGLGWSESGRFLQARVNDFGDSRGWITVGFKNGFSNGFSANFGQTDSEQLMQIIKHVVGIYLSTSIRTNSKNSINSTNSTSAITSPRERSTAGRSDFTARQLAILAGMIEGKTNHELASELGFSVSTIRHETMRIYQTLAVSDRREAAREALDRKIF